MKTESTYPSRVGLYAWGGPNTIRLLKEKHHSPKINEESFRKLYSKEFVAEAVEKIGLTDLWMTYMWGFSDETEKIQEEFLREHLPDIQKLGVTTYGYVQGFNVIEADYKNEDFFCKSAYGRNIAYSKNRLLICPSNPATTAHLKRRVEKACTLPFDAIFVDNMLFGQMPFVIRKDAALSFGCHCKDCKIMFKKEQGYDLPVEISTQNQLKDFLQFRARQITKVIQVLSECARANGKKFGVNLYDPFLHTPEMYFGFSLKELGPHLDYYLFENHTIALDSAEVNNTHFSQFLATEKKPVFVISYRYGIGVEGMYDQETINALWSDAQDVGFYPCLKGSEFKTNGEWHALDLTKIHRPTVRTFTEEERVLRMQRTYCRPQRLKKTSSLERIIFHLVNPFVAHIHAALYTSRMISLLYEKCGLHTKALRTSHPYLLDV